MLGQSIHSNNQFAAARRRGTSLRGTSLRRNRRGAAIIEFAICIPFLTLIVLASIECTNYIFLRQALVQSAYEGARKSVSPNSDNQITKIRINEVLDGRNVKDSSISFNRNVGRAERGEEIVVTVSAKSNRNLLFGLPGFRDRDVTVQATMVKE